MKNLRNLTLASSLLVASLGTTVSQAADVKTAGQAISVCKAQAKSAHPDYKRSKASKIKQTRGVFKIKMKVITEAESMTTHCEIAKDGTVTYSKA